MVSGKIELENHLHFDYACEYPDCSFYGIIKLKSLKEEPEKVTMELEIDFPQINIQKNVDDEWDDEKSFGFTVTSPNGSEYKGKFLKYGHTEYRRPRKFKHPISKVLQ